LDFVKEQAAYHDRQAIRFRSDPKKLRQHTEIAETFRAIIAAIERDATNPTSLAVNVAASATPDRPPPVADLVAPTSPGPALTPADLDGLPAELLVELGISESESQDLLILNLVEAAGGVLSLDKLLIAIYRKTGEVHKRQKLTARLYRMTQKKLLYSVPRKKGVYSILPQPEAEP
jgi:hypothetical protein